MTEYKAGPAGEVWTYDDFSEGLALDTVTVALDAARLNLWETVYGPVSGGGALPRGMLVSAMIEAFISSAQPRPAGNIHASQTLEFSGTSPQLGDLLTVSAVCVGKQIKNDRKWITIRTEGSVGGVVVCRGDFLIIWKL